MFTERLLKSVEERELLQRETWKKEEENRKQYLKDIYPVEKYTLLENIETALGQSAKEVSYGRPIIAHIRVDTFYTFDEEMIESFCKINSIRYMIEKPKRGIHHFDRDIYYQYVIFIIDREEKC